MNVGLIVTVTAVLLWLVCSDWAEFFVLIGVRLTKKLAMHKGK